jgi:hypothetical protein
MSTVSSLAQIILEEAGYETWLVSLESLTAVCFEDDSAMGFVCTFDDADSLISRWRGVEHALLTKHAPFLRSAGQKAWNVYSVFLSEKPADAIVRRQLSFIEENLELTRKIAASGLVGRNAVATALLPLLPLQYRPSMDREDLVERLKRRIEAIVPGVGATIVDSDVPPADVVSLLNEKA